MPEIDYPYKQKIVSLGGGTGQYSFLTGIRQFDSPEKIAAIAGTWDDGRDSGRRRVEELILPPGDPRQCMLALVQPGRQMRAAQPLFNYRNHKEESLGNEVLSFYTHWAHGDQAGLDYLRDLLLMDSDVIFVCPNALTLYAETASGLVLKGESEIDTRSEREDFDPSDRIVHLYFDTDAQATDRAVKAILEADKIVIPSGSLYGSLLPHLLVNGIPEAIKESKAKFILVSNLMSERGQTDGYLLSDHLEPIQDLLEDPKRLDYIIVGTNHLPEKIMQRYLNAGQTPVEVDLERCRGLAPEAEIVKAQVASYTRRRHLYRHDYRLAKTILELD